MNILSYLGAMLLQAWPMVLGLVLCYTVSQRNRQLLDNLYQGAGHSAWMGFFWSMGCALLCALLASALALVLGLRADVRLMQLLPWCMLVATFLNLAEAAAPLSAAALLALGEPAGMALGWCGVMQLAMAGLLALDGCNRGVQVTVEDPQRQNCGARWTARIWPLPLLALLEVGDAAGMAPALAATALLADYQDLQVFRNPRQDRLFRPGFCLLTGLALLGLSRLPQLGQVIGAVTVAALCLLWWGVRYWRTQRKSPWCALPERGARVLHVSADNPLGRAGLDSGDIIVFMNGGDVVTPQRVEWLLRSRPTRVDMEVLRQDARVTLSAQDDREGIGDEGLWLLPKQPDRTFAIPIWPMRLVPKAWKVARRF